MTQDHNEVIDILADLYPKCFFAEPRLRRPIKQNILADINKAASPELRNFNVGAAVDWYCSHLAYRRSLTTAGTPRIDLNGNRAGSVTETEARVAAAKVHEIAENRRKQNLENTVPPPLTRGLPTTMARTPLAPPPAPQTEAELVGSALKKLARAASIITGDDDDGMRAVIARPIVKMAADDLQSLLARLDQK